MGVNLENLEVAPVSVVIPCYRSAGTIGKAVDSVYRQTLRPGEVLVIDDASTDDSFEVIKELQARYPEGWMRITRLEVNSGPSCARNRGWDLARYPYISFLDADDSWHERKIEIQYSWMAGRPEVALTGHHCCVVSGEHTPAIEIDRVTVNRISRYRQLFSNQFATPSVMVRNDINFRFLSGQRYSEDYLLWCTIATACPVFRIDCILGYLYKPRYGKSGLSADLWQMEAGELANYLRMYRQGAYSLPLLVVLLSFSLAKYLWRLVRNRIYVKRD